MSSEIRIETLDVLKKTYHIRKTGRDGKSIETTIPREAFEREARKYGLTLLEAIEQLEVVWHFDGFPGLYLTFNVKSTNPER